MKGLLLALCILKLVVTWDTVCASRFEHKFPELVKSMVIKSKEMTRKVPDARLASGARHFEDKVLSDLEKISHGLAGRDSKSGHCGCQNKTCGCCLHMTVPQIHLDDTVCLNVSYLPKEIGVQVALVLDGKVIFQEKVSVKNPPPICANIPHLKKLASLCLRLYDLQFSRKSFAGCADIEAELEHIKLKKFDLGCFHIP